MNRSLGSRYVLHDVLGRGAMGEVFRGSVRESGAPVAVKVLKAELVADTEVVSRFVQERSILTSIDHPNVVRVVDLVVEGDTLGIVMELVRGKDLRRTLAEEQTHPPIAAVRLFRQVLAGLTAVHDAGVLHRDIKPENILLDFYGGRVRVKLTDFGVARLTYGASPTRTTGLIGTPDYMAPETALAGTATSASDLYSAGTVLYEMLAGRTPFGGGPPLGVLIRQAEEPPPPIPGLPLSLWAYLESLLAKDPYARPRSAAQASDMVRALEPQLAGLPALPSMTAAPAPGSSMRLSPGLGPDQADLLAASLAGSSGRGTVLRHRDRGSPHGEIHRSEPERSHPPGVAAFTGHRPVRSRLRSWPVILSLAAAVAVAAAVIGLVHARSPSHPPAASRPIRSRSPAVSRPPPRPRLLGASAAAPAVSERAKRRPIPYLSDRISSNIQTADGQLGGHVGALSSGREGGASTVQVTAESLDISDRADVHKLRKAAIGLGGVLFISFAAMSPLTGQLGNVPIAVGLGNGIGAPAGFEVGIVMLVLFSVGYVKMMRNVPSSGGFYSFISHGLGRPLGMAAGWSSIFAYAFVVGSLMGAFGYFGNITIQQFFHFGVPWPYLGFGALVVILLLGHFDVRLSSNVLGIALIGEIIVLTVMDVAVFAHGGGPSGVPLAPINPVNAFKGLAPGVGIFFAVWSWVGFETIPNYAEESRNPRRIGAQALFICVIGGGLFFAVCAWAAVTGWGLHNAVHQAATNGGSFYYGVTAKFAAQWVTDVMEWLILTSSFACALSFHNTHSRYLYVIGREKIFHHRLGRTHPDWKSPHVANAMAAVIEAALVGLFLVIWYSSRSARQFAGFANAPYYELFGWFAIVATFTVLVNMTLSSLATIVHFRRPENRHERNLWTTEVIPALAIVAMGVVVWLLWANLAQIGGSIIWVNIIPWLCLGWLALGIVLALVLRKRSPEKYEVLGRMVNIGIG